MLTDRDRRLSAITELTMTQQLIEAGNYFVMKNQGQVKDNPATDHDLQDALRHFADAYFKTRKTFSTYMDLMLYGSSDHNTTDLGERVTSLMGSLGEAVKDLSGRMDLTGEELLSDSNVGDLLTSFPATSEYADANAAVPT